MALPTPPDTPEASGQTATPTHSSGAAEGSANDDAVDTPLPPQQHHQQRLLGPQQVPPTPETPIASNKRQSREEGTAASIESPPSPSPASESTATPASTTEKPTNEDEDDNDDVELIPRELPFPASQPQPRRKWRKQRGSFAMNGAGYGSPEATRSMPPSPHSATEAVPFKPRRGSRGAVYEDSRQVVPAQMPSKRVAAEPKSRGLRVKLNMNLEVEITLKAQLYGDLLLTVL